MTDDPSVGRLEQAPSPFRPHLPALDGIRGMAVLMVVAHHLLGANTNTGNAFYDSVSRIHEVLWMGVELFFVLSGFLITGILYDSLSSKSYFKNFYARRVLRIFPVYYGFLLVLICLSYPLHLQWHGTQFILLSYTQNLGIFTKDYMGFRPAEFINLNHFWSLAVEEQFYFAWPCIVFFVRDARKIILTGLALSAGAVILRFIMLAHGGPRYEIYVFTPCRVDSLMIGGVLALVLRIELRQPVLRYCGIAFFSLSAVLACIGIYIGGLEMPTFFMQSAGFTIVALTFAALIGTAVARPAWTRWLFENSFMRFFGKYSYGLYIFHYSVDAALTGRIRAVVDGATHHKVLGVVSGAVIVFAVSVIVAYASYNLFERRFLKLKKYFEPAGASTHKQGIVATA